METTCQFVDRYGDICDRTARADKDYCKWHEIVHHLISSKVRAWSGLGWAFLGLGILYVIAILSSLLQLFTSGVGSFLTLYGYIGGLGYFGSLGILLTKQSDDIFWAKTLVLSQAMYALFYMGVVVSSPTIGLALRVPDLTFGLFLVLQVVSAIFFTPKAYDKGPIYVAVGLYIYAVAEQSSPLYSLIIIIILFAFLSDIEYGWTERL